MANLVEYIQDFRTSRNKVSFISNHKKYKFLILFLTVIFFCLQSYPQDNKPLIYPDFNSSYTFILGKSLNLPCYKRVLFFEIKQNKYKCAELLIVKAKIDTVINSNVYADFYVFNFHNNYQPDKLAAIELAKDGKIKVWNNNHEISTDSTFIYNPASINDQFGNNTTSARHNDSSETTINSHKTTDDFPIKFSYVIRLFTYKRLPNTKITDELVQHAQGPTGKHYLIGIKNKNKFIYKCTDYDKYSKRIKNIFSEYELIIN